MAWKNSSVEPPKQGAARLVLEVECVVDDLGGIITTEDARELAIMRVLRRIIIGGLMIVTPDVPDVRSIDFYEVADVDTSERVGFVELIAV